MRQRGGQRAAGVDDASDRERALAPDHLTDLPAGDHQRRHHERVERDRGLDPGHRRSDVLGDRRDRRVHDRRVQRHHELPGRERDQGDLRGANALRRGARSQRRFNMRVGAHLRTRPLSTDERSSSSICRSISTCPPGFRGSPARGAESAPSRDPSRSSARRHPAGGPRSQPALLLRLVWWPRVSCRCSGRAFSRWDGRCRAGCRCRRAFDTW